MLRWWFLRGWIYPYVPVSFLGLSHGKLWRVWGKSHPHLQNLLVLAILLVDDIEGIREMNKPAGNYIVTFCRDLDEASIYRWIWDHGAHANRFSVFMNRFAIDVHPSARDNFRNDLLANHDVVSATDEFGKKVTDERTA